MKTIDYLEPYNLNQLLNKNEWFKLENYLENIPKDQYRSWEYFTLGLIYFNKHKDINQTLMNLEIAYKMSSNEIPILNTFSDILLKVKRFEDAYNISKHSLKINPNDVMSHLAFANAAYCFNKYEEAYKSALYVKKHNVNNAILEQIDLLLKKTSPIWFNPLKGKNIELRKVNIEHKDYLRSLRANIEFQHLYNIFKNNSEELLDKDIKLASKSPYDTKLIEWVIYKNNKPIGIAGLIDIDFNNSRAEIQIGIPQNRSYGNSLEATLLVLEFAFSTLNLEKIISFVYSDNINSQKNTLHLGFEQEGLLKSHIYDKKNNQRLDLYINGLLKNDFYKNEKLMKMAKKMILKSM